MNNINLLLITFILLTSCSGLQDAGKVLRNEKINSTDEFLVKKRNPLVLPPNYEEIPEPGSISETKRDKENNLKKILKGPKTNSISTNKSSSVEESILNRIRK